MAAAGECPLSGALTPREGVTLGDIGSAGTGEGRGEVLLSARAISLHGQRCMNLCVGSEKRVTCVGHSQMTPFTATGTVSRQRSHCARSARA